MTDQPTNEQLTALEILAIIPLVFFVAQCGLIFAYVFISNASFFLLALAFAIRTTLKGA